MTRRVRYRILNDYLYTIDIVAKHTVPRRCLFPPPNEEQMLINKSSIMALISGNL